MKAVIISCFDSYAYEVRIKYVEKVLIENGYFVQVISSDFDHRKKEVYKSNRENLKLIHVPEYKKNLSLGRIRSHFEFARKSFEYCCNIAPDLIYVDTPPNFLYMFFGRYKKKKNNVKLIFDVCDLWPESLPVSKTLKAIGFPVFSLWKKLRTSNLYKADKVITECELFKKTIQQGTVDSRKIRTIYLCKHDIIGFKINRQFSQKIVFAYIGSINNLIDIDLIIEIFYNIGPDNCILKIIGDGENKFSLINKCKRIGVECHDYGIIYDDYEKERILDTCMFGLNIMKNNVFVGLTMKSLEYFYWGLALVNNIPADTKEIIEKEKSGINISSPDQAAKEILKLIEENYINEMQNNSRKCYDKYFSSVKVSKLLKEAILKM